VSARVGNVNVGGRRGDPRGRRSGVRGTVAGVLAAGVMLAGCGGGSGGTSAAPSAASSLRVLDLMKRAAPAVGGPKVGACPIRYDVAVAARAADAGTVAVSGDVLVDADTSASAAAGILRQVGPAVEITCEYPVGSGTVQTHLVVTSHLKTAMNAALPTVVAWSGVDPAKMSPIVQQALAARPGVARVMGDGKVALVPSPVSGLDSALVVGLRSGTGIAPSRLKRLAEALAVQIR
jgi:hypothetical protein